MSPRPYRMSKRQHAAEGTRQRIVEATAALHTEKGIFGTSWQDIARRADVSVGTVYKHFPSLDELVPACGALLMERTRPPAPEDAPRIIGDAAGAAARLERVADALFAFYERAGGSLRLDARERELPAVREWEAYLHATIAALVDCALAPDRPNDATVRLVCALLNPATYDAMRARGIKPKQAARTMGTLAECWLAHDRHARTARPGARTATARIKPTKANAR